MPHAILLKSCGHTAMSIFNKIKKDLVDFEIVCLDNDTQPLKKIVLLLDEKASWEETIQLTHSYCQQDYKCMVVNLAKNLTDLQRWQLMKTGVNDIIDWDEKKMPGKLLQMRFDRWEAIENVLNSPIIRNKMIGNCLVWKNFLRKIIETSLFTNNNVLLLGDSGTGKEMTGELIHELDKRNEKGEFVLLDCTTISPELSGSEFYGHEKGAFTNALYSRDGCFAMAHKGSLFLDELGELPPSMQAGLLRVIQEGAYKRVGSNTWRNACFRLICATNRNLANEVKQGRFREDLYFRVASSVFTLPTLNSRREDIPEIVRHFLRQELKTIIAPEIHPTVMNFLMAKNYPGNIRELKQLVNRIVMRYTGEGAITVGHIPEDDMPNSDELTMPRNNQTDSLHQMLRLAIASGKDLSEIKHDIANLAMEIALEESEGNLKMAAKKLNVEVRTLQYIRKRNNESWA